jgi:hypothetical protein
MEELNSGGLLGSPASVTPSGSDSGLSGTPIPEPGSGSPHREAEVSLPASLGLPSNLLDDPLTRRFKAAGVESLLGSRQTRRNGFITELTPPQSPHARTSPRENGSGNRSGNGGGNVTGI